MTNQHSAILSALTGPLALFCDFDGTLVDIAPTPDAIEVPGSLIERLANLEEVLGGAFAIITGRTIANVDGFLSSHSFSVSGSHGAERRHRGRRSEAPAALANTARTIEEVITSEFRDDDRILVERKPTGVAVHFRAAPEREDDVRAAMERALAQANQFHAIEGKMVIEARPRGTDKGAAISALMEEEPFKGRRPVFIGDDVTDEDGFRAVNAMGGIGIKVGAGESAAQFRLPDVNAVYELLDRLASGGAAKWQARYQSEAMK